MSFSSSSFFSTYFITPDDCASVDSEQLRKWSFNLSQVGFKPTIASVTGPLAQCANH